MVGLIFTLDYEIYGTGAGDPEALMVNPTEWLLSESERFGARVTIMAEVAELLAFKRQPEFQSVAARIEEQLRSAVARGHDVQLHLHPAWFNARYDGHRWHLDSSEYALVDLPPSRISELVEKGKRYLEELLQPVRSTYRCLAFRAGNWLIQPAREVVAALEKAGFQYDTTVFKHGWGSAGPYVLDFRAAHDEMLSWVVDPDDINRSSPRVGLREVPIFSRKVLLSSMLTPRRLSMQRRLRRRIRQAGPPAGSLGAGKQVNALRFFYAKKFDFCRLTFREMREFLRTAVARSQGLEAPVPVVAIGHSTELEDGRPLTQFLEHVMTSCRDTVTWTSFSECNGLGSARPEP